MGAFLAAWLGAALGFRKTRKERALERVIEWHEKTIQALARYEEKLKRIHGYTRNVLVVQRVQSGATNIPMPQKVRVPQSLWQDLREAEEPARAALRLADTYTDMRTQLECQSALRNTVNMVADEWFDITPEPEIAWAGLATKEISVGSLRDQLQTSLKRVLELDGFLASVWPWFGRLMLIRRIKAEQRRLARDAP